MSGRDTCELEGVTNASVRTCKLMREEACNGKDLRVQCGLRQHSARGRKAAGDKTPASRRRNILDDGEVEVGNVYAHRRFAGGRGGRGCDDR